MLYRIHSTIDEFIQSLAEHGDIESGVSTIVEAADAQTQTDSTECIVKIIRNTEAAATVLETEAAKFTEKAERMKGIGKGLRDTLMAEIDNGSRQAGPAGNFRVGVRKSPASVVISLKPEELEGEYQRVTVVADKRKLAKALKAGETIEGVKLKNGRHLAISITTATNL